MSHRFTIAGMLTALAVGLICYLSPGVFSGQTAKALDAPTWAVPQEEIHATPATPQQWADKVIGIGFGGHGVAMEKVQFRQIGKRTFLVGKVLDEGIPSPTSGRVSWIPTESVEYFVEFDSAKAYLTAAEAGRAATPSPVCVPCCVPATPAPAVLPGVAPVPPPPTAPAKEPSY
jgi:hypothetical protein